MSSSSWSSKDEVGEEDAGTFSFASEHEEADGFWVSGTAVLDSESLEASAAGWGRLAALLLELEGAEEGGGAWHCEELLLVSLAPVLEQDPVWE